MVYKCPLFDIHFCKMVHDFSTEGVTVSASPTCGLWLTHLLHSLLIILSLLF